MDERAAKLIEIIRFNLGTPRRGDHLTEDVLWYGVELMRADFEDYLAGGEVDIASLRRWAEVSRL